MEYNDSYFIQQTLNGDTESFGSLVDKYQKLIYGIIYHQIGNFTDAQDIAQDVFIKSYRKLNQLKSSDRFLPWLKTITDNECKIWLRQRRETLSLDDSCCHSACTSYADSEWNKSMYHQDLYQALNSLSEDNRLLITLRYLTGLSNREISRSLDIPVTTIDKRLQRTKQQLKDNMFGMIKDTLAKQKLPEDFTDKVMNELSLCPIEDGWISCAIDRDACALIMGVMHERKKKLISLTMKLVEADTIMPGQSFRSEEVKAKVQSSKAALQTYDSLNMEIKMITLYLDENGECKARLLLKQGKDDIVKYLKASEALRLATLREIGIYAEPPVVQKRQVTEDGLEVALKGDIDKMEKQLIACYLITKFTEKIFSFGLSPEDGKNSYRCRRYESDDILAVEIDGVDTEHKFDLSVYAPGIDKMFETAMAGPHINGHEMDDGRMYGVQYSMQGDDLIARFNRISSRDALLTT
ncbi:MAG: RNA polymerase sigma factor [Armatimonadota bacterium]